MKTDILTADKPAEKLSLKTYGVMSSYGTGRFLAEFLTGAFAAIVFKFYETEIGLPAGYAALATIIYSIWNAVNDPFIGHITSRPTPLSRYLGRRFPWILLGTVSCVLSFFLIFAVPESLVSQGKPLPIFLWMVISTCLYDGLYSIWEVNFQSIFPDKFRSQTERTKTAGISTIIGVFGIAGGFVIPPLFFEYGKPDTYLTSAWVIAGIAVFAAMLLIPGVKEDRIMIKRYMKKVEKEEKEGSGASFFSQMKHAFKQRNFLAFILLYFFYQSACMCMTGSVHYVGDYVLPGESSDTTIIFAGMLIGALGSVPLWTAVSKRLKSNQKMLIVTAVTLAIFSFPMTFINSYSGYTIAMTLWGLGFGGFWLFMTPALADVIDEIVVQDKKRDDGVYLGFRAFFGRLSYASQAVTFWLIHSLTNFQQDPQSPQALLGIHIHMALMPTIFVSAGVLIFIKLNTLTPEKVSLHKQQLHVLDL
ncbi:MAG: MFS transporter [Spirochaetales bacterium]|nr:MFS transporter [Spirochaetales bacterium]